MATRPVVLVYQEFAKTTATAATPTLNVCVVGPAYWIQDFPVDRADIKLAAAYGTKDAPAPFLLPTGGATAVSAEAPNNKVGALVDPSSVKVFLGSPRVQMAVGTDGVTTALSSVLTSATGAFLTAGVQAGDTLILTKAGVTRSLRVRYVTATTITVTDELDAGTALSFRVERTVDDLEVPSSKVSVAAGTNTVSVTGGLTAQVGGVSKPITFADVYVSYRSLRKDLQDIKVIASAQAIEGQLGRIDERNPLAVGVSIALQNTPSTIQCFGIGTDDAAGYAAMRSSTSGRKDIYAVVPLTQDINVLAAYKAEFDALADVQHAITNGVPQKFRVVIGSAGELPDAGIIVDRNADGLGQSTTGATSAGTNTVTFTTGITNLLTYGTKPGYKIKIGLADYTISHVNSATSLEVLEDGLTAGTQTSVAVTITHPDGTVLANAVSSGFTVALNDTLFLDLRDPDGTFLNDGVIPGDFVEVHPDIASNDFVGADRFEVATVVSNQLLRVTNKGRNTPLAANELPHGISRSGTPTAVTTLTYRVVRALDQDGQATSLVSRAASLNSSRVVTCWPDLVEVAGLNAPAQPGFYLACAVGGMVAGLPSHQGLTNLGVAGFKKIYNSNTYFSDRNITKLSNGGWMVFQQDDPGALPYIVHQLTTSPATLEFGELSMVKNRDFVSMYYSDIVDDFIGPWNINKETLGFINAGVEAGSNNLSLMSRPRIGAPILSARIVTLGESGVSDDRVELVVEVDFPRPLNTIALHIVSI